MSRIDRVLFYVDNIISDISDKDKQRAAYIHVYGVAQCCVLLAAKRGLDTLLTQVMGLLHDVYSYKTGVKELHFVNGAEMVRVAFKRELAGLFTEEEQLAVRCAVFHHSDKAHKHGEYEELLKDADVLQHWLYDKTTIVGRIYDLGKELGLYIDAKQEPYAEITGNQVFDPDSFANIAHQLASKNVKGERTDEDFMEIIRYFPESTAFDELKNAWCAAFVYHCAYLAGLRLPIRYTPLSNTRFACVEAWLEWGQENGFCHKDGEDLTPSRGDILIYDNIIPPENKPENSPWYDHIGIVLDVTEDKLSVAEGNAGNLNVSEIVERDRNINIGYYIRIPRTYVYDGWKIDYRRVVINAPAKNKSKQRAFEIINRHIENLHDYRPILKSIVLVGSLSNYSYIGCAGSDIDLIHIIDDNASEETRNSIYKCIEKTEDETDHDIPISKCIYFYKDLFSPYPTDFELSEQNRYMTQLPIEIMRMKDSGRTLYGEDVISRISTPTKEDILMFNSICDIWSEEVALHNPQRHEAYMKTMENPTCRIISQSVLTRAMLDYFFITGFSCSSKLEILYKVKEFISNYRYMRLLELSHIWRFDPKIITIADEDYMKKIYREWHNERQDKPYDYVPLMKNVKDDINIGD